MNSYAGVSSPSQNKTVFGLLLAKHSILHLGPLKLKDYLFTYYSNILLEARTIEGSTHQLEHGTFLSKSILTSMMYIWPCKAHLAASTVSLSMTMLSTTVLPPLLLLSAEGTGSSTFVVSSLRQSEFVL